jgi:hypothetical protein
MRSQDFVGLFYWACALPTIGLFGLKMTRFTNMVCMLIFTVMCGYLTSYRAFLNLCPFDSTSVFITPYRPTFLRNVLNFMVRLLPKLCTMRLTMTCFLGIQSVWVLE